MFLQRAPGELYLQCGGSCSVGHIPPETRLAGASTAGWLEKVDPVTLETLHRSPDLPSGGHLWCGAAVVHANGDIYVVNGRWMHRLSHADCRSDPPPRRL